MDRRKQLQALKEATDTQRVQSYVRIWGIVEGKPKVLREAVIRGNNIINLNGSNDVSEALNRYPLAELEQVAQEQRKGRHRMAPAAPEENINYYLIFWDIVRTCKLTNIGFIFLDNKKLYKCTTNRESTKVFNLIVELLNGEEVLK